MQARWPCTLAFMDFDDLAKAYGGVLATHQLLACGHSTEDIRQAKFDGMLSPLRHGWYAVRDADPGVVAAVRDRGVVTCASALRRCGLWVPDHSKELHNRVTRHERRQSHDRCRRYGRPSPALVAVDDVLTSLQYGARCFDEEGFVILCDSALNLGEVTVKELEHAFRLAPEKIRRSIGKCDEGAASGTETAGRLRLKSRGVKVEVQHEVPGVGHIDLLVGDRLAIEFDSKAHHTGEENYEADRTRDRKLVARGYIPMRVTYNQVFLRWNSTYADIQAALRNGYHRKRSA